MRQDTLWQGERRAARMHWWRQVLDRPATVEGEDLFNEVLSLRFGQAQDKDAALGWDGTHLGRSRWA